MNTQIAMFLVMVLGLFGWGLYLNWDLVRPSQTTAKKILASLAVAGFLSYLATALYAVATKDILMVSIAFGIPAVSAFGFLLFMICQGIWYSIVDQNETDSARDGNGWSNT